MDNEPKGDRLVSPPDESNSENTNEPVIVDASPTNDAPLTNHLDANQDDSQSVSNEEVSDRPTSENSNSESTGQVIVGKTLVTKKHSFWRPELIFIPALRRKLGNKARPLATVLIVVVLLLIGGGIYWRFFSAKPVSHLASTFKLQVAGFKLVSTIPTKNATNVNTSSNIVLNFDQPVTAAKMINNMFITPNVGGTYKQGSNADQIVFTPSQPFSQGSKVSVMVNGTYESNRGSELGSAYEYAFTTSIPSNNVLFEDQSGLIDNLVSVPSGQKETFSLLFGQDVNQASVTLYKDTTSAMLNSLVYSNTTTSAGSYLSFNDLAVSTGGLTPITNQANLANDQTFSVQQPDGLYVAVATNSAGKQLGLVWVDISNFGVILRQDDQKIVFDGQSFSNSQDVPISISFYNLDNSVNLLSEQSATGLTTANIAYNSGVDLAVATDGTETAIVPINIIDSGGDIRVDQDLSTAQNVYLVTDKPTYQVGQKIQYAGYVRDDNDAQYTNPGGGTLNLYIAQSKYGTPLATFSATIDSNGMFSGSIPTASSWLTSGDAFDNFQIFASAVDGNTDNNTSVASFTLTNQSNSSSNIQVAFSKSSYLPNDQITATITATNANGQPLANQAIDVHTFSEDYYENNPTANYENYGYSGAELPNSPVTLQLNSQGQATYSINPSSLPADGNSQLVTIQANLPNESGVGAAGGASAIVHQGDGILTFGLTRSDIPQGQALISDIYATDLSGNPEANTTLKYILSDSVHNSTLATGTVTTNNSGYASIDIPASELNSNDTMDLSVSMTDQYGNVIEGQEQYNVTNSADETYDTSGTSLQDLNISGSSGQVKVGESVNLQIDSPANIRALVTMDRGRIYNPSMVNLSQGNNNFSFTVGSNLAPSFTLTFSYFLNGIYHSEGVSFTVGEASQLANVSINPPSQVSANQPATVNITTTDSNGNPLATDLIVEVESSNAYGLSSEVSNNIFNTFYDARPIMTSSSSSLSPIGSGGGRCGGGGGGLPSFASAIGTTLFWQPELSTNSSGQASITFTPPAGSWTINTYAMSGDTVVGSQSASINAH